jgi:hypothetical protein
MTSPSPDSRRSITGEALVFFGMLMSIGGSLTVIIRGFHEWFFYVLIGLGIVVMLVGYYLKNTNVTKDETETDQPGK